MRAFVYARPRDEAEALAMTAFGPAPEPPTMAPAQFLAGGTTILDLMKLDVMRPERLVDVKAADIAHARIDRRRDGLYLGALATMADAASHPDVVREVPIVVQALELAASPQIRNMATLGGNVLQRTRCTYFRDPSWAACNKRVPGSGCAALEGNNRKHAILGTSEHCIATYAGDFAQALIALDATVDVVSRDGRRVVRFEDLHREPGQSPHIETNLRAGDLITGFHIPVAPWTRRSLYLKIRDRESYEFALASAAVALDLEDGVVREARIALGGVATKPWRARDGEAVLQGQSVNEASATAAADAALAGSVVHGQNGYKRDLGMRTLVRALLQVSQLSI